MGKHERLVAAVADAKEAQGFTWKQIATMGGVSQGTISCAINQGVTMKDERWKLICEGLGLDYDEIVGNLPAPVDYAAVKAPPDSSCGKYTTNEREVSEYAATTQQEEPICCEDAADDDLITIRADKESMFLLVMYAEGRLAKDIEAGMKVEPMKLWAILDALNTIKDEAV